MALVYASTAEGLAQRFVNNNDSNSKWTIDRGWWESMNGWGARQGLEVVDAARQNTSIQSLEVRVVHHMTAEVLGIFSLIVGQLHRLVSVTVGQDDLDDAPVTPETLDKLWEAIAACPSDVKRLDCSRFFRLGVSPRGLLALVQSFPSLEALAVAGPGPTPDHPPDDFALAFSVTAARNLTSLRRVRIRAIDPDDTLPTLLSALHASSSVKEVDVEVPRGADDLIRAAQFFCASTPSVETFTVRGSRFWVEEEGMTVMTPIFDMGPITSFSPTVTRAEFFRCDFRHSDKEKMVKLASKALQNVQFLRFGLCNFPSAMKVLEGLPRLTKFSCVNRASVDTPYACMTVGEYYSSPYGVVDNQELETLCLAVERQGPLLSDLELDLISFEGEFFPAIPRLMGACKGRLVLNLGDFSWIVAARLVEGARRLRHDLRDLRLRFVNCELEDLNYADIFQTFTSNKTLAHLEVGFNAGVELDSTELSLAAIRGLIELNDTLRTLSLQSLRPNLATEILEQIMPALATTNRSLRALEFHGAADLSECLPSARALALDMLKENDVLSTLVGFEIPEGDPVEALLRQNRYGRIFLRVNDPTPIGIWSTVFARVSRDCEVGIMYKFLRAKPGLVRRQPPSSNPSTRGSVGRRKRGRVTEERIG